PRRNPQQHSRLAFVRAKGESRDPYRSSWPHTAYPPARDSPRHDERRRRDDAALLGAKLAPQSLGFQTRTRVSQRYGSRAIPAGSTLEDWPLTYEELEPYYDIVEHEIGVFGKSGNLQGVIDPNGNVYEGPRRREYPMPPLRSTGFTELMAQAAKQLGWKPFRPPAAINSEEYRGRPACVFHGYCSRGGCHVSAKNSTAVTTIPEALKTKNLTVVDRAHITRIAVASDGRVAGVRYIRDGKEYLQPAQVVLLA